jgi:hypothetical protein
MPLEMPPETIPILIIAFFFFIFLFVRAVWFAVRTKEKAFGYSSIGTLMFAFGIVFILLGNPVVCVILMFLMVPYVIFMFLKYWKRLILAQKKYCSLKGFSLQEPMKVSDYFSLLFSMKGWLKLYEKQGKNRTIYIYSLFNALMLSIIEAWGSYRFPNFYPFPLSLLYIVPALFISAYFFSTYLEIYRPNKKEKL